MPPPSARVFILAALVLLALTLPVSRAVAQSVDERFTVCLACHGADGQSRIPDTPSLGGQPSFFVVAQLFLFREGRRDNQAMIAAAKGLTNSDLTAYSAARGPDRPGALRPWPDAHPSPPVRCLPQSGFLWARADAAPRPSARGLSAQVHARV